MRLTDRSIERAEAIQGTSITAWYLAACFMLLLFVGFWVASETGLVDLGSSGEDGPAYKQAATAASTKAAERDSLKRLAAREEAREMAEDAKRGPVFEGGRLRFPSQPEDGKAAETAKPADASPAATKSADVKSGE